MNTNDYRLVIFCFCLFSFEACKQEISNTPNSPVLDMVAVADFDEGEADFSQVLLKLQLLHTNTDILKYGIHTPEEHQQRLYYYRSHFKEDVFLMSGADTIPCYDVHAERMYMDLPYINFILTFGRRLSQGDKLLIHDIVFSHQTAILDIITKN